MAPETTHRNCTYVWAMRCLQEGKLAEAEEILVMLSKQSSAQPDALYQLAIMRFRQHRFEEAADILNRMLVIVPSHLSARLGLGKAYMQLGRWHDAVAAFRAVLTLAPGLMDTKVELAEALRRAGAPVEAELLLRDVLRCSPSHVQAKEILAAILAKAGRHRDAELFLQRALEETLQGNRRAGLHVKLGILKRQTSRFSEALDNFNQAHALNPSANGLDLHRAEILQDLKRYDEALALYRRLLEREPQNVAVHNDYNDLLYRIDNNDYLKSFDRAPRTAALQLAKAQFLMHGDRVLEACKIYKAILSDDLGNKHAALGLAKALTRAHYLDEALVQFEALLKRDPTDSAICSLAAQALLLHSDARKALAICENALRIHPYDQGLLAMIGTALRLLNDERDERLNGYDSLIRVFEIDPPDGFPNMDSFNSALCAYLDRLHPDTREHPSQTLRGGSQTTYNIFGSGHKLVDDLQSRISDVVNRYVTELTSDETHPFLSRRRQHFSYAGSWSSRLSDKGFHVNHIHTGWISSCYYVSVPEITNDSKTKQGWIKFGEPDIEVGLDARRSIQPKPGRLVLFPSYTWHGTVPFSSTTARTTIAFDLLPR